MNTLRNTFHNTEIKVRTTDDQRETILNKALGHPNDPETKQAKAYIRRIKGKLCGIKGCMCGNSYGERY